MITDSTSIEGLLRELAPQALGVVARRYGSFADTEDAVQEALISASQRWPEDGTPDHPLAWLVRVAGRNLAGRYRSDTARRRREAAVASWAVDEPVAARTDDTLTLFFMCSHPRLSPTAAIPLTLRAVGGLTTREIAAAFFVSEATIAQRISRAKATIRDDPEPFRLPGPSEFPARLANVMHALYLMFTEGHTATTGEDLTRADIAREATRLTRMLRAGLPDEPEVAGLLALMMLTDARRPARLTGDGRLVPLDEQDRRLWDRDAIREGVALVTEALHRHRPGEYQLQAAVAAVHDQAPSYADTNWSEIVAIYSVLDRISESPAVTMNHAIAVAMIDGPVRGLEMLEVVAGRLGDHHRLHATRARLLELAGDRSNAAAAYERAVALATSAPERDHLLTRLGALRHT